MKESNVIFLKKKNKKQTNFVLFLWMEFVYLSLEKTFDLIECAIAEARGWWVFFSLRRR